MKAENAGPEDKDGGCCKKGAAAHTFQAYCSHTSIHGLGYLGEEDRSIFEKIWWFIVIALSISTCSYLIYQTWAKWNDSPVIVSFSQQQTPIWSIPFPAITICPESRVLQTTYNYTHAFRQAIQKNLEEDRYKEFLDISMICNMNWPFIVEHIHQTTDKDAIKTIENVAPGVNEAINYVVWKNTVNSDSHTLFTPILTEEGLCFTFNMLSEDDMFSEHFDPALERSQNKHRNEGWSLEDGYPENVSMNTYPHRALKDGIKSGMSIILLSYHADKDFTCGSPITGFKILLHNPAEMPKVSQNYFLVSPKRKMAMSVTPSRVTTSTGLTSIPAMRRHCYFSHEKSLRFYKIYTQENCRVECFSNFTKSKCGCVPFFIPRDNGTHICGYGKRNCIRSVEDTILEYEMSKRDEKSKKEFLEYYHKTHPNATEDIKIYDSCNCLPSCASLNYAAVTSTTDFYYDLSIEAQHLLESLNHSYEATQVDIFFRENYFLSMHRKELYGHIDFLASCGGLLGLFMGFSLISLIEIVYFATFRSWCTYKRNKKKAAQN